jgi:hypothetical protein
VIDLGQYGKLLYPVRVDGDKWYYYWDRSGDGTTSDRGTLNGGKDKATHAVLNELFAFDINGQANTTIRDPNGKPVTTDTYRYATLNGVKLALPTIGTTPGNPYTQGTPIDNNPIGEVNPAYDDLMAIADGLGGTGTLLNGKPADWPYNDYWSASLTSNNTTNRFHDTLGLGSGYINSGYGLGGGFASDIERHVALQVLAVL